MKLIFAQGNPGNDYARTRHNVGFQALDRYVQHIDGTFISKPKFFASIAECMVGGEKVLFVKPTTFYNDTGKSLRAMVDFYKLSLDEVLVVHDELALAFGKIRVRHSGRDAGNNGIKSLNSHIGDDYTRIRIGIQNEQRAVMGDTDFVLGKFGHDEHALLDGQIFAHVEAMITAFITTSLDDESVSIVLDDKASSSET